MKRKLLILAIFVTLNIHAQKITATVYHATQEQCNEDFTHTATMFKIDVSNPFKHKIIAVSRDLERSGFLMNSRVLISGTGKYDGIYTIRDRMNRRWVNKIDILINKDMSIGKWLNVKIKKL